MSVLVYSIPLGLLHVSYQSACIFAPHLYRRCIRQHPINELWPLSRYLLCENLCNLYTSFYNAHFISITSGLLYCYYLWCNLTNVSQSRHDAIWKILRSMFTPPPPWWGMVAQIEAQFVLIVPPGPTICAPPHSIFTKQFWGPETCCPPPKLS